MATKKQAKRRPVRVQRWEYNVVDEIDLRSDDDLNCLGSDGWELVTVDGGNDARCVFKRPVPR